LLEVVVRSTVIKAVMKSAALKYIIRSNIHVYEAIIRSVEIMIIIIPPH